MSAAQLNAFSRTASLHLYENGGNLVRPSQIIMSFSTQPFETSVTENDKLGTKFNIPSNNPLALRILSGIYPCELHYNRLLCICHKQKPNKI